MIEVAPGATLLWRLQHDMDISRREQAERTALRVVGVCFVALALYILYASSSTLIRHVPPERSIAGIVIASASGIVVPRLARAKRQVARQIGSGALGDQLKTGPYVNQFKTGQRSGSRTRVFIPCRPMDSAN
jgi:hypothetical protein